MKSLHFLPLLLLALACSGDKTSFSPDGAVSLIQNPSFEAAAEPTADGWLVEEGLAGFYKDTPPGGGEWSLALSHGMPPEWGWAQTFITDQSGKHVYHLTSWAKSTGVAGSIGFGVWYDNEGVRGKTIAIPRDANDWSAYEIIDTIDVRATDSLAVVLCGYGHELEGGVVLFDLIQLRILGR